jgi:hypothetical protein
MARCIYEFGDALTAGIGAGAAAAEQLGRTVNSLGWSALSFVAAPEARLVGAVGSLGRATVVETQLTRLGLKLENQLSKINLTHLQGALSEMRGIETGYDHVTEVQEGMGGIRNTIRSLNRILSDERLSTEERRAAQRMLSNASRRLDAAEDYLRK